MAIQVGERIPESTLKTMGEQGPTDITTEEIFSGKKVVLFAVPGAFTPGCSVTHLPGFVVNADKIKAMGVDTIVIRHPHSGAPYLLAQHLDKVSIINGHRNAIFGSQPDRVQTIIGVHVDAAFRHERADDSNAGFFTKHA